MKYFLLKIKVLKFWLLTGLVPLAILAVYVVNTDVKYTYIEVHNRTNGDIKLKHFLIDHLDRNESQLREVNHNLLKGYMRKIRIGVTKSFGKGKSLFVSKFTLDPNIALSCSFEMNYQNAQNTIIEITQQDKNYQCQVK